MDWADRIGRRIRLRDLHIVLAVAECGSMTKASSRLAISHPVVSKTISDLEHSLGVRLFDRNSQGVELTTYGKALLDCGNVVFDDMRQGLKQIEFLTHPDSGELRIGCPEVEIAGIIPAIVERFSKQYPRIRLRVIHANTSMSQFHELRSRSVEFLIGRVSTPFMEDDLALETLFTESLVAVAAGTSPWVRRRNLKLAQLIDAAWVLPPYDSIRGPLVAEIFRANNVEPPHASVATLSLQLTTTLIATGRFFGFVPLSVARSSGAQAGLKILPLKIPDHRFAIDIITVKNRTLSPLAKLFIDCAGQVANPLTP
jgi:DNA-binding transcriptional LysR family regulator